MATNWPLTTDRLQLTRLARHNILAAIGVVLVVIFLFAAIFAPWVAPSDPAHIDLPNRLEPPSRAHWCGTDELGRDILSRLIYGSRISMSVGASVVILSLLLGLIVGSLAGYYGGGIDRFVNIVLMNAFLSFPEFLSQLRSLRFGAPAFQPGVGAVSGRVGWICAFGSRPSSGHARKRICGSGARRATDWRVITRHILPNIIQPVIVQAAIEWRERSWQKRP
jgi:peptide/nickel transport system permease protein